jgi:O-antigen ligase
MPSNWSRIKTDPVVLLFVLFLLFLAIQTFWLQVSQTSDFESKQAWDWISLWLFFTVAWCIRGEERHIFRSLILVMIGLFLRLLYDVFFEVGWDHFVLLLHSRRYGFFFSVNEAGHFSAVMIFGFLLFLPRIVKDHPEGMTVYFNILFWIAGFALTLEILLRSGSRTAWLAFVIISTIFLPWVYLIRRDRFNLFRPKEKKTLLFIVIFFLITGLLFVNIKGIERRLSRPINHDMKTIKNLLSFNLKNIPLQNWDRKKRLKSPIARRLILFYYGSLLLAERPWLGYGTKLHLPELLSYKTGNKKIGERSHLHNGFLIVLIRFGLIGGSIIFLAGLCLLNGLIQAYRSKKLSKDVFLFLLGALLITAITGLTSFRWTHRDFRFFWLLLAGMSYTRFMFVR